MPSSRSSASRATSGPLIQQPPYPRSAAASSRCSTAAPIDCTSGCPRIAFTCAPVSRDSSSASWTTDS